MNDLSEILGSEEKKILVNLLGTGSSRQERLFDLDNPEKELEVILNEICYSIAQGKPLYQRWTQEINGKRRQLSVPNNPLRIFLEPFLLDFIKGKRVHKNCHGGEYGWSVKKSLETHLPCACSLSFDLKSAYENVSYERVYNFFYSSLSSSLPDGYRRNVAKFLAMISTVKYEDKRGLSQGSPISTFLFNRIAYPLDEKLSQKAEERRFRYSRWIDDFTISSPDKRGVEYFLGAVELIGGHLPVSREKIFFQDTQTIYLLGHKITESSILKNSKEEKLRNKSQPLNFEEWFGENKIRSYCPW
jgi:hypothetical protein